MPPKKKNPKVEEPAFTDEECIYIHEAEGARYEGCVRRYAPTEEAHAGGGKGKAAAEAPPPDPQDAPRVRHGYGTYTSPTLRYAGHWTEDAMDGEGRLEFLVSGNSYEGQFARNTFEGRGIYCWASGARYEGWWRQNRMHGEGVYTDADGNVWKGRYYNGTGPGLQQLRAYRPGGGGSGEGDRAGAGGGSLSSV